LRRGAVCSEFYPRMELLELVSAAAERDASEEPPERQNKFGERDGKREAANPFVVIAAKTEQRYHTDSGQENQDRKQWSGGH
jgi:hypothetical protein